MPVPGFDNLLEEDVYNGEMGHAAKHNAVNDQVNFLTEQLAPLADGDDLEVGIRNAAAAGLRAAVTKTTAHDSYAGKTAGALGSSYTTDSGHETTLRDNGGGTGFSILGGYLTHTLRADAASSAAYLGVELEDRVGRIWADFRIPSGSGSPGFLVLIVSQAAFTTPPDFSPAAAHFRITKTDWHYELVNSPFATPELIGGTFDTPLADDTIHSVSIDYGPGSATATVTLPNGQVVEVPTDAKLLSQRGPHATIELYAAVSNTSKALQVVAWGADTEDVVANATPAASRRDVARAVGVESVRNGRVLSHTHFRAAGPTVTAVGSSTTTVLTTVDTPMPRTDRMRVEGDLYIEEFTPGNTGGSVANLYVGAYIAGNETYGALEMIKGGWTPANPTRYWTGSAMAGTDLWIGRMFHFDLEIDATAFSPSQEFPIVIKLLANATGLFRHRIENVGATACQAAVTVYELPVA